MNLLRRLAAFAGLLLMPATAFAQTSPAPYTSAARYDAVGRVTGTIAPDPDGAGALHSAAIRNTYDGAGRLTKVETGELAAWQSEAVAPVSWADFTVLRTVETIYDASSRKTRDTVREGQAGTIRSVTDYSYDSLGRLTCTAVRMNEAQFGTTAGACFQSGGAIADRITRNVYDAAGQRLQLREGVGTSDEGTEATWAYSPNGKLTAVIDGNGNRAELRYDGYDRQICWIFPSVARPSSFVDSTPQDALATAGAVSGDCVTTGDYERYGYDANGNRTSLRKRDGSTLSYSYDALNRVTVKTVPERPTGSQALTAAQTRDVHYSYDLRNLQLSARFDSQSGEGVTNGYDGFGRLASSTQAMDGASRTISYQYDANGNRTRINQPVGIPFDTSYYASGQANVLSDPYGYTLATFTYDTGGRLSAIGRPGATTGLQFRADGPLLSLTHSFAAGLDVQWTFQYNPPNQITQGTRSNDAYAWTGHYSVSRAYTANGLNQYGTAGGATFGYDANGNLTSDGSNTYVYDVENRMVSVSGAHSASVRYDPLGRLYEVSGAAGTSRFLYDGDALITEYDLAGNTTARYAYGPGVDNPMVWYPGGGPLPSDRRNLLADHQGSIVAISNDAGVRLSVNSYDEYGIPGAANTGRFQYTGQAWIPELGMYYYKARIYSPTLGRFMQIDPIGYEGGNNLYAYAGDDPVNLSDPSGNCPWCIVGGIIGFGTQAYSEYRAGTLRTWGGAARVLISTGAGALSGGASVLIARTVVRAGVGGVLARTAANSVAGAAIGGAQGAATARTHNRQPTMRDVRSGALTGAVFSGGGSLLGEGAGAAVTSALSRGAGSAGGEAWTVRAMTELNGHPGGRAPGGSATPSQPPPPIPGAIAGPTVGEAVSNLTGNAPNAVPPGSSSSDRCRGPCM